MENKPGIAIIIHDGIGTGHHHIGVPALERIVKLLANDFSVTVFQLSETDKNFKPEGFELITVTSSNKILRGLKFLKVFRKTNREKNFKVLHGLWIIPGGFFAVLAGKIWGIKSIVSLQGKDAVALPDIKYGQLRNPFFKKLAWWTLRNATEVTSLTLYLVHHLSSAGFSGRDIHIIPFGVDPSLFKFHDKHLSDPVKILHIGNFQPEKDQDTLLEAFKIISDQISAELTIIGEGRAEAHLRKLLMQLKLVGKVSILHPMPYIKLPDYFHQADLMMHTSLSEGEAMVVAEAMSCGVLVCGTKVGLMYDLPECFVTVPIGDYKKLAAEVIKLLHDREGMREKRKKAHEWSNTHTLQWTVNQYKKLYNS